MYFTQEPTYSEIPSDKLFCDWRKNSKPAISDWRMKVCFCLDYLSLKPNIFLKYGFFKKLFLRMNL